MGDRPTRYSIAALLNAGVQPLPDLPNEELAALGKSIGRGPLAVKIVVSRDGILLDGHQRLKAMAATGRKYIDAGDVIVDEATTSDNALERAVQLNVQRRHLSVEDKATLARRLQHERRWSQGKIAKLFGVSRPAVSQWLGKTATDDTDDAPTYVVGLDGKTYVPDVAEPVEDRPFRNPWAHNGPATKTLVKAKRYLQSEPLTDLGAVQLALLGHVLSDLIEAAMEFSAEIEKAS
jgi:predicted XRE-type DNA-binding protein